MFKKDEVRMVNAHEGNQNSNQSKQTKIIVRERS